MGPPVIGPLSGGFVLGAEIAEKNVFGDSDLGSFGYLSTVSRPTGTAMNFACLAGLYNFGRLDTLPIIEPSGAFEDVPLLFLLEL
jgi:hypothetical protein